MPPAVSNIIKGGFYYVINFFKNFEDFLFPVPLYIIEGCKSRAASEVEWFWRKKCRIRIKSL